MRELTGRALAALLVSASVALVGCPEKPRQPRTAHGALPAPSLPATAESPPAPQAMLQGLPAAVDADGPAGRAGIAVGDVVLAFGGAPVADDGDLARRVADTPPGTTARAEVWRNGRRLAIDVWVAAAPRES